MRGKYLNVFGECAERIYASMEKTQKGSWCILQMSNQGYLWYKNRLRMRGKYLNVFGECPERIYASMEKTQKGSWCILQIRQEM
jgi:hypothetical protein